MSRRVKFIERGVIIIADKRIPVSNTYKEGFLKLITKSEG